MHLSDHLLEQGMQQGMQLGKDEMAREVAMTLLQDGFDELKTARLTMLPVNVVHELADSLDKQ